MTYGEGLRAAFPELHPAVGDLYLLEAHEVAELPARAGGPELAAVLHARPDLVRLLVARHPPVAEALHAMMSSHAALPASRLPACEEFVVWEVADWILYERAPGYYDSASRIPFGTDAITEVVSLDDAVVVDAGAGTGRVAFAVAGLARHVFAVEPVAALRRYMRDKAAGLGLRNVFVLDGLLHQIPLPAGTADVLVTCNAVGWDLERELREIGRVVRPRGTAVHLLAGTDRGPAEPLAAALRDGGYVHDVYRHDGTCLHRYVATLGEPQDAGSVS